MYDELSNAKDCLEFSLFARLNCNGKLLSLLLLYIWTHCITFCERCVIFVDWLLKFEQRSEQLGECVRVCADFLPLHSPMWILNIECWCAQLKFEYKIDLCFLIETIYWYSIKFNIDRRCRCFCVHAFRYGNSYSRHKFIRTHTRTLIYNNIEKHSAKVWCEVM